MKTRSKALERLIYIVGEPVFVVGSGSAVTFFDLLADEMLAEQQIIDRVRLVQAQQPLEIPRIILAFEADEQLDVALVFLAQPEQNADVVLDLRAVHPEAGAVAAVEGKGRVIREAERFEARRDRFSTYSRSSRDACLQSRCACDNLSL